MTIKQVKNCLELIRQQAVRDCESAKEIEDALHQSVLEAIAEGDCEDPRECARLALESIKIEFPKHGHRRLR